MHHARPQLPTAHVLHISTGPTWSAFRSGPWRYTQLPCTTRRPFYNSPHMWAFASWRYSGRSLPSFWLFCYSLTVSGWALANVTSPSAHSLTLWSIPARPAPFPWSLGVWSVGCLVHPQWMAEIMRPGKHDTRPRCLSQGGKVLPNSDHLRSQSRPHHHWEAEELYRDDIRPITRKSRPPFRKAIVTITTIEAWIEEKAHSDFIPHQRSWVSTPPLAFISRGTSAWMHLSVPMEDADGAPPQSLLDACVWYGYQPEKACRHSSPRPLLIGRRPPPSRASLLKPLCNGRCQRPASLPTAPFRAPTIIDVVPPMENRIAP